VERLLRRGFASFRRCHALARRDGEKHPTRDGWKSREIARLHRVHGTVGRGLGSTTAPAASVCAYAPWEIALTILLNSGWLAWIFARIKCLRAQSRAGSRVVLGDAGYGDGAAFREELEKRELRYAVGVLPQAGVWLKPPKIAYHCWVFRAVAGAGTGAVRGTIVKSGSATFCNLPFIPANASFSSNTWARPRSRVCSSGWYVVPRG
jgi:DDE superfamily endonuclease